jgi:hypothetical protein
MAFYDNTKDAKNVVLGTDDKLGTNCIHQVNNCNFVNHTSTGVCCYAELTSCDNQSNQQFGYSAAVNGQIVIGSPCFNSSCGKVYTYSLDGTLKNTVMASDCGSGDTFGSSVAIGNGKVVVGSPNWDYTTSILQSGAVYIYDLDLENECKVYSTCSCDQFGRSVSVGDGRIVVGAPFAGGNGAQQGRAYIYDLDGTQKCELCPFYYNSGSVSHDNSNTNYYFGYKVAVGNNRIAVGALNRFVSGEGTGKGAVYLYTLDGDFIKRIMPATSDHGSTDQFGISMSIGSGKIAIGAPENNTAGTVFVYDLDGDSCFKITTTGAERFGQNVEIANNLIYINQVQYNSLSGRSYVYDLNGTLLNTISNPTSSSFFGAHYGNGIINNGHMIVPNYRNNSCQGNAYIYKLNEYYDGYTDNIASNIAGKYTKHTG